MCVYVCVCVCLGYWGEGRREVGMAYVRCPCVRLPQSQCRLRLGYSAELCIQGDLVRGCLALGARTGG